MSYVPVAKPGPSLASGKELPVWWEDELVRWVARGSRQARAGDADPEEDGLDGLSWDVLYQSVAAAHRGDDEAHVAPLLRYEREVPHDGRAGLYLWYLLRYRVAELLGRRPGQEDLHALAGCIYPAFAKLIRGDRSQLEDTLLTVFGLAAEDRKVSGGRGVVMGSAALGVLLDDPESELAAMRPHLAQWRRANADEFRDLEAG
jgi:hypothetical protein